MSFEEYGRVLAGALQKCGVFVETYFVSTEVEVTKHEYQLVMNTPAGEESFRRMVAFIGQWT